MTIRLEQQRLYMEMFAQNDAEQIAKLIDQNPEIMLALWEAATTSLNIARKKASNSEKMKILSEKLAVIEKKMLVQGKSQEIQKAAFKNFPQREAEKGKREEEEKKEKSQPDDATKDLIAKLALPPFTSSLGVKVEDALRQSIAVHEQGRRYEKTPPRIALSQPPLEVAHYSLLRTPLSSSISHSLPMISPNLLAHIHGDSFIQATGLEGNSWSESVAYMHAFFQQSDPKSEMAAQLFLCNQACSILFAPLPKDADYEKNLQIRHKAFHAFLSEQLILLEPGKALLLPGGWGGASLGHAIYCQITKQIASPQSLSSNGPTSITKGSEEEALFTFKAFNTGAGIERYHPLPLEKNNKKLYAPYIAYQDVKLKNILRPECVGAMLEILLCDCQTALAGDIEKPQDVRYTSQNVYKTIFSHLEGTLVENLDLSTYQTAQHSGTCCWSGLMAVVRQSIPPRAFAHLHYRLGLDALVAFYLNRRMTLAENESEQSLLLLEKSITTFAHHMLDYQAEDLLEEKALPIIYATLEDLRHLVFQAKCQHLENQTLNANAIFSLPTRALFGQVAPLSTTDFAAPAALAIGNSLAHLVDLLAMSIDMENTPTLLQKFYATSLKAYREGHCEFVSKAIIQLFEKLPEVPSPGSEKGNFWHKLAEDPKLLCMQQITQLSELLLQAAVSSKLPDDLNQVLATSKGLQILIELSEQSKDLGEHYRLLFQSTGFHKMFIGSAFFSYDKSKDRSYLEAQHRTLWFPQLGNSMYLDIQDTFEIRPETDDFAKRPDFKLMHAYLSVKDNLKKFLIKYSAWAEYPAHIHVALALHANDQSGLPQEFCLIKRQALVVQFLTKKEQLRFKAEKLKSIQVYDPEKGEKKPLFPVECEFSLDRTKLYFSRKDCQIGTLERLFGLDPRFASSYLKKLLHWQGRDEHHIVNFGVMNSHDLDKIEKNGLR